MQDHQAIRKPAREYQAPRLNALGSVMQLTASGSNMVAEDGDSNLVCETQTNPSGNIC